MNIFYFSLISVISADFVGSDEFRDKDDTSIKSLQAQMIYLPSAFIAIMPDYFL